MLEHFQTKVPIYRCALHVSVGPYYEWTLFVRARHPNVEFEFGQAPGDEIRSFKTIDAEMWHYIWLPNFNNDPNDIALVAHEAIHVAADILVDAQVRLCDASLEALTYLTQWVVQEVLDFLTKHSRSLKEAVRSSTSHDAPRSTPPGEGAGLRTSVERRDGPQQRGGNGSD